MRYDLINRAELPTVRIEIPKRLDDETLEIVEALVKAFKAVIDSAPAVDAEPVRHGYWIEDVTYDQDGDCLEVVYKCSECGRFEPLNDEPYCNCGAKMDAEEKQ